MRNSSLSRRGFGSRAALLASAAAVSTSAEQPPAALDSSEVEARLANIVREYGSRLSPEQVTKLRKVLAENGRMLAAVRSFSLHNGDTPASVLKL